MRWSEVEKGEMQCNILCSADNVQCRCAAYFSEVS